MFYQMICMGSCLILYVVLCLDCSGGDLFQLTSCLATRVMASGQQQVPGPNTRHTISLLQSTKLYGEHVWTSVIHYLQRT